MSGDKESLDYTLEISKAVLKRYVQDYVIKMYGSDKGIDVEIELNPHFEDKDIPGDDGTKSFKWFLLDEVIVSTISVTINVKDVEVDNLVQAVHSDILHDIGLSMQTIPNMKPSEEPTEIIFSVNGNSLKKLAQKMDITPRNLQTAMLEMHDSGMEHYKAITLNHGELSGGRGK